MAAPALRPTLWLRGRHAQTLAAAYLRHPAAPAEVHPEPLAVDDGTLMLHDNRPAGWQEGGRVVVMLHGLGGSARSGYMLRIAARLGERGIRTLRVDLRNSGAAAGLSPLPHHSGRWRDALAALEAAAARAKGSPLTLVGFSLGGTVTLRLLAEYGGSAPHGLDSAVAVCPPIELAASIRHLRRFPNQFYDRHFARIMARQVAAVLQRRPDAPGPRGGRMPGTVYGCDDAYIAPVSGFRRAARYYRATTLERRVGAIRLPTLVVTAQDDPLVPFASLARADWSRAVERIAPRHGGHLGFIGRPAGGDPDGRWLDWRVVEWIAGRASL